MTTTPKVTGSWNWIDDQTAYWRPERYYAPGTSVTVAATIYGVPLGDELYGEEDEQVPFAFIRPPRARKEQARRVYPRGRAGEVIGLLPIGHKLSLAQAAPTM